MAAPLFWMPRSHSGSLHRHRPRWSYGLSQHTVGSP